MAGERFCESPTCGKPIAVSNPTGFCYLCSSALAHDANELEKELDRFLSLEADFVAWCLEHGQPNPHDD